MGVFKREIPDGAEKRLAIQLALCKRYVAGWVTRVAQREARTRLVSIGDCVT